MNRFLRASMSSMEQWWGMLLWVALPVFAWLSPALVGGRMIAGEPAWYHVALYTFYKSAIVSDDSFLWNPLNFSGVSFCDNSKSIGNITELCEPYGCMNWCT